MRPCFVLLLVPVLLATTAHARAQDAARLTLRDALQEARRANPELVALQRQYESTTAAIPEARFLDPPALETQIWGWPVTTVNPARTDMYMFTAEQSLPGRGKRAARELVATRDASVSQQQIVVRANGLLNDVKQTYADLLMARATAELYQQQAPILDNMAEAATLRYAAGHTGQHDTVKSIVELARLQADAIEWRERARVAETRLNVLLGRAPDAHVPDLAPVDAVVPALSDAERRAVDRNPGIAMASAEVEREEAELARLQGERRPDFVIGGGYMLQPGGAGAWTARGGLTWPNAPWSRGRLNTSIDAQEKRVVAARARRDAAARSVLGAVHEAYAQVDAERDRLRLLETSVIPHIEHAFDVARAGYAADRAEFADLLDTQRVLLSTRVEVVAVRAALAKAVGDLEMALGDAAEN